MVYFVGKWPSILSHNNGSANDKALIFFVIIFGNIFPLVTSAVCHNFYCLDQTTHKVCWFLDFFGIITGMLICGIGYIHFAFYCSPLEVIKCVLGLVLLWIIFIWWCWSRFSIRLEKENLVPRDRFPEFSSSLSLFVGFASFFPLILTWLFQKEYFTNEKLFSVLVDSTLCPLLLSFGVVAFAQGAVPGELSSYLCCAVHF